MADNTSAPGWASLTPEALAAARKALDALGPPPPRVEFYEAPELGPGAVLVDGEPAGVLTAEQWAELKARLETPEEPEAVCRRCKVHQVIEAGAWCAQCQSIGEDGDDA